MNDRSNDQQRKRDVRQAELEGRKYQKSRLQSELDHSIQTHQDKTTVSEHLATVEAEIARLEEELRNP